MIHITVVGAGSYGSRITDKYKKLKITNTRAIVSRSRPKSEVFFGIPFFKSAGEWKKKFGIPNKNDVFDICVHHDILAQVLNDFVLIGAKNFILPKPIALNNKELEYVQKLISKHNLRVIVASQWHYSDLLPEAHKFLTKNKSKISKIDIVFNRSFDEGRRKIYSSTTAFLPHIIQILHDLALIKAASKVAIEHISSEKIKITYSGNRPISAESNINAAHNEEVLRIFLHGSEKASFVINFDRNTSKSQEDVLEKMIEKNVSYFNHTSVKSNVLTFSKYVPVARHIADISENSKKIVGIIGGGIFGVLTALEVASRGYPVVIFEKEKDIISGASLVNHGRIHMGYHYPRDKETVLRSLEAKEPFEKYFGKSVVKKIDNYYMVARDGSMITHHDFLAFCRKMKLPHTLAWPKNVKVSKDKIAVSVKVPEKIFDANRMRAILLKKISESGNIALLTNTKVIGLKKQNGGFTVRFDTAGKTETVDCAVVVNATYGAINHINHLLGLPLKTFQYELCEILVTSTPWKNTGWMIMDGPFFSAMPFGFSGNHLFYDVELSVLERVIGKFPKFKYGIDYYNDEKRKIERFNKYEERWKPWIGEWKNHRHLHSMYVPRIVLHKEEKTDKRPTMVHELVSGFWQIFSGKIATSVPTAIEVSQKVHKFLKKKGK